MKYELSNAVFPFLLLIRCCAAQNEDLCATYPIKASKLRNCPTASAFCSSYIGGTASYTITSTLNDFPTSTITATTIYTSTETSYSATVTIEAATYTSTEAVTTTVSGTACPLEKRGRWLVKRQADSRPSCGIAADADPNRVDGACNCILASSTQITVTGTPVAQTVTESLVTCITVPATSTTTMTPITCITSTSTAYDCRSTGTSSSPPPSTPSTTTPASSTSASTSAEATLGTSTIPTDPDQPVQTPVSQYTCAEPQTCGNYILYPCAAPENAGSYCACGFDIDQNPTCFNGNSDCGFNVPSCTSNAECGQGFACMTQTCCSGASCLPLDAACPNLSTASRLFGVGTLGIKMGGVRVSEVEEVKSKGPNAYWA